MFSLPHLGLVPLQRSRLESGLTNSKEALMNRIKVNRTKATSPTTGFNMGQSPPAGRGKGYKYPEWTRLESEPYRPVATWYPKSRGEFGVNDYTRGVK